MKNTIKIMLSLVLSLGILTACGEGSDDKVKEIQDKGTITIATSGNNPPTIYPNEKNELVGLDVDWANLIADELGVDVEWKEMDFKGTVPSVKSKQADMAMSGISVTEEREKEVDFTEYYAFEDVIAIYNPDLVDDINGPEDIEGKIVGVVAGSHNGEAPAEEIGGYKDLKTYPSLPNVFEDLKNKRIDVALTGRVVGGDWMLREGNEKGYVISEDGYSGSKISIAISKENEELTEKVSEIIKQAKDDGKYEELAKEHTGEEFVE